MGRRRPSFQFVHVVTAWGLSAHVFLLLWSDVLLDRAWCFNHQLSYVSQHQPQRCSTFRSGRGATNTYYERKRRRQQLPFHDGISNCLPASSSTPSTKDSVQPTTLLEGPSQNDEHSSTIVHPSRREWLVSSSFLLVTLMTTMTTTSNPAYAAGFGGFGKRGKSSMYVVDTRDEMIISVPTEIVETPVATLSSEYALLKILPVKNPVFRTLETKLEELSALRFKETNMEDKTSADEAWLKAQKAAETALSVLKLKRGQLQPVFNPEDSTELSIEKQIRGELLIEELRDELSELVNATKAFNTSCTFEKQRECLVALGCLGELLVREYPYKVPSKGKFSFLPRLLGRAKVTFRFKRDNKVLGNITIMADGYTAPITAGNFVDLCLRNFYTGLRVREATKRFGPPSDQESATVNILGSFGEGFYDPLTAKLRRIPLEIIRLEQGSGQPKLSYSTRGLSDTSLMAREDANLRPSMTSKPLLKFDTPGMLAWNHNENDPNGGSSEFFGLGPKSLPDDKRRILDGDYAPFGFIIRGYDLFLSLKPGDIIDSTVVDSFGRLNLVKIRESNFQQAAQGLEVVNQE